MYKLEKKYITKCQKLRWAFMFTLQFIYASAENYLLLYWHLHMLHTYISGIQVMQYLLFNKFAFLGAFSE